MSTTAPLARYIRRSLGNVEAEVFRQSEYVEDPTLVKNRVSRILTYRGCFNPPHQGHKDTLCHGFFRGGNDMNIIAAILYFLDDHSVRGKYPREADGTESFVLTQAQRINLFNNGGLYGGWHYCFPNDGTDQHNFRKFTTELQKEAAKDGFDIRFVVLMGPDYLYDLDNDEFSSASTIVVGTGHPERTQIRAETKSGLRCLKNHHDWQMLPCTGDLVRDIGTKGHSTWLEQKLEMLFPEEARKLLKHGKWSRLSPRHLTNMRIGNMQRGAATARLQTALWHLGQVRHCKHISGSPWRWVRYVPTRFFGMQGGAWFLVSAEEQLSSTSICRVLTAFDNEHEFVNALNDIALSPTLLFSYVRKQKQKRKKELQSKQCGL
jgi:hypothetical protein